VYEELLVENALERRELTTCKTLPPPGRLVRFAPLIAGNVPVRFPAGMLVKDAPEPLKVVAVQVPVTVTPELVVASFKL